MPGDVVGGCKERGERTRPRTSVGDAKDRKGSDLGSVKGYSRGRGNRTRNRLVMVLGVDYRQTRLVFPLVLTLCVTCQ